VGDDGRGIGEVSAGQGYGLRNMAARAEDLGGRLEVRANDHGGTLLEWRVPVK
jgi:signal transduction histidine kinase